MNEEILKNERNLKKKSVATFTYIHSYHCSCFVLFFLRFKQEIEELNKNRKRLEEDLAKERLASRGSSEDLRRLNDEHQRDMEQLRKEARKDIIILVISFLFLCVLILIVGKISNALCLFVFIVLFGIAVSSTGFEKFALKI